MALKEKVIEITKEGRDQGKKFLITEMPLIQLDKWANRLLSAAAKGGIDLNSIDVDKITDIFKAKKTVDAGETLDKPIDVVGGILELGNLSIKAIGNINYDVLQDSLDELVSSCVQVVSSGGVSREMLSVDEEIQDLATLWTLRKEAFNLHIDFLTIGNP